MSRTEICPTSQHIALPCVYRVSFSQPFSWLRQGLGDLIQNWPLSLTLGMVFSLFGYGIVDHFIYKSHLAMALTAGFLLIAPFLAIGFYGLSCKLEDKPADDEEEDKVFSCIRHNSASIGMFGILLAFILSGWERISAIMVALMLQGDVVSLGPFSFNVLWASEHWEFLVSYIGFGAVLAALVFGISVVSLPMMMDRRVDVVTAVITSLVVVRQNLLPMLLWAAIIVVFTAIGMATLFIGMVVIFPLLGHASWYAYRDTVQTE